MLGHDVTVCAGRRVIGQVGVSLRIDERIAADTNCEANSDTKYCSRKRLSKHRVREFPQIEHLITGNGRLSTGPKSHLKHHSSLTNLQSGRGRAL